VASRTDSSSSIIEIVGVISVDDRSSAAPTEEAFPSLKIRECSISLKDYLCIKLNTTCGYVTHPRTIPPRPTRRGLTPIYKGTNTHSTGLVAWLNEQGCAGCKALSVKMVDDAATRVIAEKIIELAQRGVRDVSSMTVMTLKEFKGGD
jgi:hypothetical protein